MRRVERALVVGGAGFYGSWLVETLLAGGAETTVLDTRDRPEAVPGADLVLGDAVASDLAALVAERRIDAVFQLSGTGLVPASLADPAADLAHNASTTLAVLEAARVVRDYGAEVVLLLAVVDRGGTAASMASAEGWRFDTLFTAADLGFEYEGA